MKALTAISLMSLTLAAAQTTSAAPPPPPVDPAESILSEDTSQAAPNPKPPPYTLLRFNEDYRYLANPANRTDPFDRLKYIPLDPHNTAAYLSLGGEIRERFESFSNPDFGVGGGAQHDDYLLQRITLHADLHLNERVRFFVQGISGLQWSESGESSPVNQDPLDLQQAFGDLVFGDPEARDARLTLRGGRFEMTFGSARLVATRSAPNIPFKFDGIELIGALGKSRLYGFVVQPAEEEKYRFDGANDHETFWGIYGTTQLGGPLKMGIDLYFLGLRDEDAEYQSGAATEERHTIGTRLFGKVAGWDYDLEPVFQFGSFGDRDILAWTIATNIGFTFEHLPWTPRLGLKADIASGDDGASGGNLGTFNPLFFKAAYFNDASLLRPSNIMDLHPSLQLHPDDQLLLTLATDSLWRYSRDDAVYGPGGNIQIPADAGNELFIGQTLEAAATWQVDRHLVWNCSYTHLFAGDFVSSAGGGDVDFLGTWLTFTW
ncbi:MAG TPA: alginate export family protein [Tepidisphaeraceae bacterium]|nr:alginate export family protein [Tepidisphaeraceae bacterium]